MLTGEHESSQWSVSATGIYDALCAAFCKKKNIPLHFCFDDLLFSRVMDTSIKEFFFCPGRSLTWQLVAALLKLQRSTVAVINLSVLKNVSKEGQLWIFLVLHLILPLKNMIYVGLPLLK